MVRLCIFPASLRCWQLPLRTRTPIPRHCWGVLLTHSYGCRDLIFATCFTCNVSPTENVRSPPDRTWVSCAASVLPVLLHTSRVTLVPPKMLDRRLIALRYPARRLFCQRSSASAGLSKTHFVWLLHRRRIALAHPARRQSCQRSSASAGLSKTHFDWLLHRCRIALAHPARRQSCRRSSASAGHSKKHFC